MAEGVLAPPEVLVRYLAIFRRVFAEMEAAAAADDLAGMWLCQWAADALHNVPGMLADYDRKPDDWNSPQRLSEWMVEFPESLAELGGPPEVVTRARELFESTGSHTLLGLTDDLRDFNAPPKDQLERYIKSLKDMCLETRYRLFWSAANGNCQSPCRKFGLRNGRIGGLAKDIPLAIAQWNTFDRESFRARWEAGSQKLEHHPQWTDLVHELLKCQAEDRITGT